MSKPKIVFADHFVMTPAAMRTAEEAGEVVWAESAEDLVAKARGATAIASEYNPITERVIEAGGSTLKGVVAYGVGYNHIDVKAATKRGIFVANCRGSNAEAVAEMAVCLMLNLCRGAHLGDRFVREGEWASGESSRLPPVLLKAGELRGKSVGLVGMGEVGRRVARIANGFEMKVRVFDPYLGPEDIAKAGAEPASFPVLMKESDFVSVHVPLSEETRGLIDGKAIALMKPAAYLVNTSRGAVVDEKALIAALRDKRIAGAGLDVFETEPLPRDSPLFKLDNVVLSPHVAGHTVEADAGMAMATAEECARIARGEVPVNLVNRAQLASQGTGPRAAPQKH